MEKIYKTDNAYISIDKINNNFEELADSAGNTDIISKGEIPGMGTSFSFVYFNALPGDLIRIEFPDGNFASTATGNQGKFAIGYRDTSNTIHSLYFSPSNLEVQRYYDVYVSTAFAKNYKDFYLAVRAYSGSSVRYVITKQGEQIKGYFRKELADSVEEVKNRLTNKSCLVFPLITDIHYRCHNTSDNVAIAPYLAVNSAFNMAEIGRQIRLDNVICLGDIIDGLDDAELAKADADDMMHLFSMTHYPLLNVLGNHDDNRYGDTRLPESELFAYFLRNIDERVVRGTMNGANWYRDIDHLKIRIIGLCAINYNGGYNYTTETRNWFTDVLGSMPQDYVSIVVLHVPPVNSQTWNGTGYSGGTEIANIVVANIDKVIAVFQGHTHLDNVFVSPFIAISLGSNKCYNIQSMSGAPEDSVFQSRETGTKNEDLFDIVICDTQNKLLSCIRFGAGVNRYIHYLPISVSAGGTVTLTPSVISPSSWTTRASESQYISINNGVVSISSSAVSGSRLIARASDASGNLEIWVVKVS